MVSPIGRGTWGTVVTPPRVTGGTGASFSTAERIKSHVKEASDVVAIGNRLVVVGDHSPKLGVVEADGSVNKVKLPGLKDAPSQFEGVAYDPEKHNLFVSREESHEIWRYDWNPDKGKEPKLEKKFDIKHLGGPENKGLEGLVFLPANVSPTRSAHLIGAKEGKPKELVVFDAKGGSKYDKLELEKQVRDVCKDVSAITLDPKTGHLFISSDESSTVAEIELRKESGGFKGRLVQSFAIRDDDGKPLARIEGLAFNPKGDLFVLTENDGELLRLARKPTR